MKELNKKLEQTCEKYSLTRQAYEALCETSSLDLRERFAEAIQDIAVEKYCQHMTTMENMMIYVEVVEYETEQVLKRIGPFENERMADRCCNGVDRNLNHDRYYSQTCESETELECF